MDSDDNGLFDKSNRNVFENSENAIDQSNMNMNRPEDFKMPKLAAVPPSEEVKNIPTWAFDFSRPPLQKEKYIEFR